VERFRKHVGAGMARMAEIADMSEADDSDRAAEAGRLYF
jgi:hypothetical protein